MIHGTRITLRPATKNDRRDIYMWLVASDVTASMMGPPTFPEVPIPTEDNQPYHFLLQQMLLERPIAKLTQY